MAFEGGQDRVVVIVDRAQQCVLEHELVKLKPGGQVDPVSSDVNVLLRGAERGGRKDGDAIQGQGQREITGPRSTLFDPESAEGEEGASGDHVPIG